MPKMKTNSAAKKRFKKSGTGKIKMTKAFRRHLLTSKSRNKKRQFRNPAYIHEADHKRIAKLLPYE